jgi:hypothetical protein
MLPRYRWHANVTDAAIFEACERGLSSRGAIGFCLACGAEEEDVVEPDAISAEAHECEACGEHQVYSAEALFHYNVTHQSKGE